MRKKVDERIRTLIENGVKLKHRSLFVIVGDKSRDQIVTLNYMLSKAIVKARPPVLWCYKEKLELSSHKRKRAKQVKSYIRKGLLDEDRVDTTLLFLESGTITYRQYKDSEKVLGNTFGMCVLQDFEALNPNLLARTIETVEGGGLIILLLRSLSSLTSLYTMVMDVHERFRTESHSQATARFNERFLLSLASCKACVVMDDELNILPISSHIRNLEPVSISEDPMGLSEKEKELKDLKDEFHDQYPVGPLIKKCCTVDQAKAVIAFLDSILDKTLRSTIALTASRGRGKSAALGLAVAGAVAAGYSNIFVTAPSPENLRTLFEFIIEGFKLIEYKEHLHYDLVRGTDQEFKKAIIQINIYKEHRQTIQYLRPSDHGKLSQVELLVIDEAAAIPLPIVKSLLGPYLVFLSSTINGYEGTGRSLSLKLLDQLQSQSQMSTQSAKGHQSGRNFKKIELNESIRYAPGDPIESWLNGLLCLDVTSYIPSLTKFPGPDECDLYYVNRDTLFSYHKDTEAFLQRMMALYVASHYKNSPNDLQLMADAPAHHLFVLLGPVDTSKNQLPDILCVIQVCLEGQISRKSALRNLSQGHQPHGDQIPWKFCQQFQDDVFPSLSGARIVRIAVHPNAMRLGYGSKAVELLSRYYEGQLADFNEEDNEEIEELEVKVTEAAEKVSLLTEKIVPKESLPPLLYALHERRPEKLHYIGVSFGLTKKLFRFWARCDFIPFYIGQVPNNVTGEHSCMVLRSLDSGEIEYNQDGKYGFLTPFYHDFKQRFRRLLGTAFQSFHYKLAMSILAPKIDFKEQEQMKESSKSLLNLLSPYDLKRLDAYTNSCVDFPMILDLVPILAHEYFQEKIPVTLSPVQTLVLLCMGLQNRDIAYMKKAMKLEAEQIMSSFRKVMTKLYKYMNSVAADQIESSLPRLREVNMPPLSVSLDEDLSQAAKEVREKMKAGSDEELDEEYLKRFEIHDEDGELEKALQNGVQVSGSGIISVKSKKQEKRRRDGHGKSEETKEAGSSQGKKRSHKKNKKSKLG